MKKFYLPYIATMSLIGVLLVAWAGSRFQIENVGLFATLFVLVIAAQIASNVSQHIKITFSLATAVSLATVALFGLEAGILIATFDNIIIWLYNIYRQRDNWRGSCQQLFFNTGLHTTAVYLAGTLLLFLHNTFPDPYLSALLAWFATALLYSQLNTALLAIIIYLQQDIPPTQFWSQQRHAITIDIGSNAILGLLLTTAATALDIWGILLFTLPLLLAAYTTYLYMAETNKQLATIQQQAATLTAANHDMETWAREKNRFLAILSHDMRNSLNAIRLYSETLQEHETLPFPKRQRMAQVISLSERDLSSAVDNILEIEQVQAGKPLHLHKTQINLAELIQDAVDLQQMQAANNEIELFVGEQPANIYIKADKLLLMRTLTNLLSNGIKYTPKGGQVVVTLVPQAETVAINVADTGYGIPHNELDNIFKPFYRVAKHEQQAKGSGLGLAIVQHYVEAHRGQVAVNSQEGRGSLFSIQLPYE